MTTSVLVFIPSPGAGHLPPAVELAKLLLDRDQRLSITIIIMNMLLEAKPNTESPASTPRLRLIDIPSDESTKNLVSNSPNTFISDFLEHQKPHVRNIVGGITESHSVRLAGFVVDMFFIDMADVANEFGVPTYLYFTAGAASLGLMFGLQAKHDDEGFDVTDLKDSELEVSIPSYANPVPAKVFPLVMFDKNGGSKTFIRLARKYREAKGIIVNTFEELEKHALESFSRSNANIPPVFPVGPILNLKNSTNDGKADKIMAWLNDQPEMSVVFLCFGSMGSFSQEQVKEIAVALEKSGQRFLWSLRLPASKEKMGQLPKDYENYDDVLPEGFLERTSGVGKKVKEMKEKSRFAVSEGGSSHASIGRFLDHVIVIQ
ncbi:hypothetical protein L1887_02366 [Cichorium endivia]|nr:hypothetical protein L1887_02366 [Cichorium endivia]